MEVDGAGGRGVSNKVDYGGGGWVGGSTFLPTCRMHLEQD